MEWLLRISMQIDSRKFVAPTVASAALGLLLPLTAPKSRELPLSEETRKQLDALKIDPVPRRERILADIVWLIVILSLGAWASCLVFACKPTQNPLNVTPIYYALATHFVAVIFSEIREAM